MSSAGETLQYELGADELSSDNRGAPAPPTSQDCYLILPLFSVSRGGVKVSSKICHDRKRKVLSEVSLLVNSVMTSHLIVTLHCRT